MRGHPFTAHVNSKCEEIVWIYLSGVLQVSQTPPILGLRVKYSTYNIAPLCQLDFFGKLCIK